MQEQIVLLCKCVHAALYARVCVRACGVCVRACDSVCVCMCVRMCVGVMPRVCACHAIAVYESVRTACEAKSSN